MVGGGVVPDGVAGVSVVGVSRPSWGSPPAVGPTYQIRELNWGLGNCAAYSRSLGTR